MSESSYKVYASEEYVDQRVPPSPDGIHKMLVTDADGKQVWEERTHWAEEQKEIVIVPETTDNTESVMGRLTALVLNNPFGNFMPFSVGQSYKVTWDGAEYETVAELEEDGVYMLPVSQGGLSYVLWIANSSPELIAAVVENGYGGTHTIMITCVEQNCKKIDVKRYLPHGYPYAEEKTMPIGTTEITVDKLTDNNLSMDSEALDALSAYKQAMSNAGLNSYDNKFYAICNGNRYLLSFGSVEGSGSTAQWTYACNTADDLSPFTGIIFVSVAGFPPVVVPAMPNDATDEDYEAAMARLPLTIKIQGVLPDEVHPLDPKYLPEDHINTLIDTKLEAAHPTELITIPASAWTGTEAPYFAMNQACSIATMTNKLIVSLSPTLASDEDGLNEMLTADTYNAIAKAKLMAVMQADGAITLAAYGKKPEIDIPVIVTEVG